VTDHVGNVAPETGELVNGDESRFRVYDHCRAACDRLDVFQWEWISDRDADDRAWVRAKGKPIIQERGINTSGLLEAAEEVAAVVQRELHNRASPLNMLTAIELWRGRLGYLNPLIHLSGNQLAKEVEARVSPDGRPLAICIGSAKVLEVPIFLHGRVQDYTLRGFAGCLSTFRDAPYGPGRRWPRWCARCRPRKSNIRDAAIRELQRRTAEAR
jgi:hypothetical protein